MTSAFALNSWTKLISILPFLVFGLLIVLIFSPPSIHGSTQYRLWILAYNVDPQAGFVSACTSASTVEGVCEYFDMSKLFVEKGGKKDFIAGFVTTELNSPPPADMQMCLEAQLLNGSNASPGDWFQCKPIIKDNKGFYTSQIDFTGLKYGTLQPYQATNNMTAYEPIGNLSQPEFGTELTGNVSSSTISGNMSIDNPVLTSGGTFYDVQFFVSKAFSLGRPVFIKAEVDKENQIIINSGIVDTETLITQAGTTALLIKTLTIEDKEGQKPSQVWACLSAVDAMTSPECERPIQLSSDQYFVNYDYASLVQDLPSDITTEFSNMTDNMTVRNTISGGGETIPNNLTSSTTQAPATNEPQFSSTEYSFVTKWGSNGTGDGQFIGPWGIATDSLDNVYVTDSGNSRIKKTNSNGNFITKWGDYGNGDGQFFNPHGIAIDTSANVYVTDAGNDLVKKFDSNGNFITKWRTPGTGDGQFKSNEGIATDSLDNVYVMDYDNNLVQKFDSNGNFITKWGSPGTGDGQFNSTEGIATDSSGNVYVTDSGNDRVQKFDSNGNFITKWGSPGNGDGQFAYPEKIVTDSSGNVYVADFYNDRVQKFDSNGNFITKWGSKGTGDGQFDGPSGIAVDSLGNVYVADFGNNRIQKFSPNN